MWTLAISKPESIHSFYKFCHITSIQSDCEENISLRILLQFELLSVRERGKAGETQHLLFSCNQGSSSGVPPIFSHFYLCVFPSVISDSSLQVFHWSESPCKSLCWKDVWHIITFAFIIDRTMNLSSALHKVVLLNLSWYDIDYSAFPHSLERERESVDFCFSTLLMRSLRLE